MGLVRKYRVKVNGKVYEVEVEMLDTVAVQSSVIQQPQVVAQPVAVQNTPQITNESQESVSGRIKVPLAGRVVDIKVKEGQEVNVGDLLLVIEAMKMNNDVTSPVKGVVKSINVKVGDTVEANQLLMVIE